MSNGTHYYNDNLHNSHNSFKPARTYPEKQGLLRNSSEIPADFLDRNEATAQDTHEELLPLGPVTITPCWEGKNLTDDELNFKSGQFEDGLYDPPPRDRCRAVYFILLLHGIGTLMPWNMFITARSYFEDYKLNVEDPDVKYYKERFMPYITLSAQIPNVLFNFINIFIQIGGSLTTRIVISILTEVVLFIVTIILAMIDSFSWAIIFFWVTIASVVLLNMANGIYQNSVYGMAATLPMKYTSAVVLGSNISGTLTSVIFIISLAVSSNIRTAAIYYFITALFILLACFDTYFALPLSRFYRFYEHQSMQKPSNNSVAPRRIPYWTIFKKCFPQLLNVFLIFFVTLSIFPNFQSKIQRNDPNFIIPEKFYSPVVCFFVFNFFAMIGSIFPSLCRQPGPRGLIFLVVLRILLIPTFLLCNYQEDKLVRGIPVLIPNDWAHFGLSLTLGFTGGYFSSLAMMYAPRCVDQQHAPVAGMMAATSLIFGIFCGINFSVCLPNLIELISV